ncbi:MAG: hypothetical protein JO215_04170 [Ktedonobacteraceae bacterium]|nr:hypothetical protein [Ktedonobacteraceae bacterium]MBV9712649.1 hypothetical protein [Ktedonobacteraceae bacterium]
MPTQPLSTSMLSSNGLNDAFDKTMLVDHPHFTVPNGVGVPFTNLPRPPSTPSNQRDQSNTT